jgi:hypothetical protein
MVVVKKHRARQRLLVIDRLTKMFQERNEPVLETTDD